LDDLVEVYVHALNNPSLRGAVNAVAPEQVTNTEFTRALGRALGRPTFLDVPEFALRLMPGRMAQEALLASERVLPEVLMRVGFNYRQPTLAGVLATLPK
jgi:NAD dependent epimerase/dehydratase family enzyme